MKKFQEGGLTAAMEESESIDPSTGILGLLAAQYQTSPEAQKRASEILDRVMSSDAFSQEDDILEQMKANAEQSRQALREARARLLQQKYDPRQKWLAAAAAFGQPTRTGAFGETAGNVAGALREPLAEERAFQTQRDEGVLALDQQLAGIDSNLLGSELKLSQMERQMLGPLAREALQTLGKGVGKPRPQRSGGKSMDQKMATELVQWETQGRADATKSISELQEALDSLSKSNEISGPWIGMVPKTARDVLFPESGNVQDIVETTAQRSLKAVLGGQFGQREGEMLLARTFNPRLSEKENAKRAYRLLQMIQIAAEQKNRAAEYFRTHQTMQGFDGKFEWTVEDFMLPEDEEEDAELHKVRLQDGRVVDVPSNWDAARIRQEYPLQQKKGGRIRYAEGGIVDISELETTTDIDDLQSLREDSGILPGDVAGMIGGTAAGGAAGMGLAEVSSRLEELQQGISRGTRGERRVAQSLETGGMDPTAVSADVKRGRRMRVPERFGDRAGRMTRVLGEQALMAGGEEAEKTLGDLEQRHSGSRERTLEQVNRGLKPAEFFESEEKLTSRLYENARPLYEQAYRENPGVKAPKVLFDILESPDGKKAVKNAVRLMRNEGKTVGKADVTGMVVKPSLEFLDFVKRGFDQIIRKEENMGPTALGRSMRGLRKRLLTYLDKNTTEAYAKARSQYKGDLEILEALDVGRRDYTRMPPVEAENMVKNMTSNEIDSLRIGVAQRLYDDINRATSDKNAPQHLLGSPDMRKRLRPLFHNDREYKIFIAALERERELFQEGKKSLRRAESGRERRLVDDFLSADDPLGQVKEKVGRGPLGAVLRVLPSFGSRKKVKLSEEEADEIIKILNTSNPADLDQLGTRLKSVQDRTKIRRAKRGKAGAVGAAVGAALTAMGLADEDEEDED